MKQISINLTYSCNRNCNYCFAKGFLERWPQEITLEGLESIFKWLTKQGIKAPINFLGGEPSLFSKINSALDLAERYGFKIVFCTNGIFDIEKVNIESPAIALYGINLNPPSEYSSQELKILYSNLKALRRTSQRIGFRFNITSPDISYDYLINACERLNIHRVELSTIFPSISGQNKYIKKDNLKEFSRYILRLTKDLVEHSIRVFFAGPFPLCLFSKKEREFLIKNSGLHGACSSGKNYAITPNLTVLPCSALAIEGPSLESFKNEKEIFDYYKEVINKLKWEIDLFPQCKNCTFKKKRQCHGSCLIYKFLQIKDSGEVINKNLKVPGRA